MKTFKEYVTMRENDNYPRYSDKPHDEGDEVIIGAGPHKGKSGMIEKVLPNNLYNVMITGGEIITMNGDDLIPGDYYSHNWSKSEKLNFKRPLHRVRGQLRYPADN